MRKTLRFAAVAAIAVAAVSCASAEKMAKMADNIIVTCDPPVLEVVAGNIDADITVTYPKGYFDPKVVLEVTPVLIHERGEAKMDPFIYQGSQVLDNYTVISKNGQSVTEHVHFDYVPGMEDAVLELRGVVVTTKNSIYLPFIKVADGCNTTYMLVKNADGAVAYKADNYQGLVSDSAEGQIKYLVNSADVRSSELKGSSIKDFLAVLNDIKSDERAKVTGTEIIAYASPEGKVDFNNKLSEKRAASAEKAWSQFTAGKEGAPSSVKSAGEDWEGFQKLVKESDIKDKELILRVLSMYSDPNVRENEIRNMSQVFTALKSQVLPELRRARFIANIEYDNYSEEELLEIVEDNIDVLDEDALLHAATLVKKESQKEALYKKAVDKYKSDRAQFNLGVLYLNSGAADKAEAAFKKVKAKDADVASALGVVALRNGDLETAAKQFKAAGDKAQLGVVDILSGRYEEAVQDLKDVKGCCHNLALAYILTGDLDQAEATIHCECAKCLYLKAIIAARRGDVTSLQENLEASGNQDVDLLLRSQHDIEFAGYSL